MIFILGIIAFILSCLFAWSQWKNIKLQLAFDAMEVEKDADIAALEIGKDELQETYEQQFLSHLEKISYLQIRVEELETERNTAEGIIVYHSERCHGFVGDTFGRILERMKEAHVMPAEITRPVVQDNLNH